VVYRYPAFQETQYESSNVNYYPPSNNVQYPPNNNNVQYPPYSYHVDVDKGY
jgi:hypothetical protein